MPSESDQQPPALPGPSAPSSEPAAGPGPSVGPVLHATEVTSEEVEREVAAALAMESAAEVGTDGGTDGGAAPKPEPPPAYYPPPSFLALPALPPPPLAPVRGAATPVAPPSARRHASISFLVLLSVISLAADLATKAWAKARLQGYDPKAHGLRKIELLKGHVDFIFAQNPGGAWSFLRGLPDSLRRPFFLVVSAAAIVFIINIYLRVYRDQTTMKWGLPLALGGAMGNLADRIRYGWVVDFIDFSMKWGGHEHHWPTFNVADVAIVFGVGLMAIDMLRTRGLHLHADHAPLEGSPAPNLTPTR